METFRIDPESGTLSESGLAICEAVVKSSELLVIPADTVYGIVSVPFKSTAVQRLQGTKDHGEDFPPPILVSGAAALDSLLERPAVFGAPAPLYEAARWLATAFQPDPLTIIARVDSRLGWGLGKTGGTIALRQPNHPVALQILEATNPLVVTSVDHHGAPPATDVPAAIAYFWDKVAVYMDASESPSGQSSTTVNLTKLDAAGQPAIAHANAITAAEIRTVLGS